MTAARIVVLECMWSVGMFYTRAFRAFESFLLGPTHVDCVKTEEALVIVPGAPGPGRAAPSSCSSCCKRYVRVEPHPRAHARAMRTPAALPESKERVQASNNRAALPKDASPLVLPPDVSECAGRVSFAAAGAREGAGTCSQLS